MAGKKGPRKLLVASVGVATINYVLASSGCSTVANLPAPHAGGKAGAGGSASAGAKSSAGTGGFPTVANLPAPPDGGSSDGNER